MYVSDLYRGAQRSGMDTSITFEDFQKFDDIIDRHIHELRLDAKANKIIKTIIADLKKIDIDYILQFDF
jgi:hypothetical protein